MNVNITDMARAYSYIRFSTPEQAEGDSLRRQTELSEEYAKKHKLVFDRSLNLKDEGLSAFSGANRTKGALAVFLKAVETGIVKPGSYLLVESLDRLSRDTLSAQMTLFMELINAGITVVTLADEQIYSKATIDADISKLMLSLVIMMRSHEESLMKSRRLVAAWTKKRRDIHSEKLTSVCPHWLKLNADRKSFHVVEERAKVLRRIFQMAIDGVGQASIARKLNEEKVPTWGRNDGWHLAYIHSLLRNRAVLGEFQPRRRILRGKRQYIEADDAIKDYYPRIIDEMTWQKVQARKPAPATAPVKTQPSPIISLDDAAAPWRRNRRAWDAVVKKLSDTYHFDRELLKKFHGQESLWAVSESILAVAHTDFHGKDANPIGVTLMDLDQPQQPPTILRPENEGVFWLGEPLAKANVIVGVANPLEALSYRAIHGISPDTIDLKDTKAVPFIISLDGDLPTQNLFHRLRASKLPFWLATNTGQERGQIVRAFPQLAQDAAAPALAWWHYKPGRYEMADEQRHCAWNDLLAEKIRERQQNLTQTDVRTDQIR